MRAALALFLLACGPDEPTVDTDATAVATPVTCDLSEMQGDWYFEDPTAPPQFQPGVFHLTLDVEVAEADEIMGQNLVTIRGDEQRCLFDVVCVASRDDGSERLSYLHPEVAQGCGDTAVDMTMVGDDLEVLIFGTDVPQVFSRVDPRL